METNNLNYQNMNKIPQYIIELSEIMQCPVILVEGEYIVRDIDQCLAMIDDNIKFKIVHWPKTINS